MDDYELDDEIDVENDFETVVTKRSGKSVKSRGQKPIENADQIPLFQHADKKQANCVSYIKVIKTSRPNHGYKGQLPPTSTEETLLATYGPGTYTLQGCNDQHQIIIEQHEVYIAGEDPKPVDKAIQSNTQDDNTKLAIKMANHQAEQSMMRQEETHRKLMEILSGSQKDTQGVLTSFFEKMQTSQGEFFAAMAQLNAESKTQQAQMFQQTIAMMTIGHQQNMEFLRASNDRERDMNNPMLMVQLLMQGLKLGKEFGDGTDQDPWITALKEGGGMLNSLVQLKGGSGLPLPNPSNPTIASLTTSTQDNVPKQTKKPLFTPDEIKKIAILKKKLTDRGLDLSQLLDQIEFIEQSPDDEIPGDENQSDDIPDENAIRSTDSNDFKGDSESTDDTEGTETV